jgi:hypothetical protein
VTIAYLPLLDALVGVALDPRCPPEVAASAAWSVLKTPDRVGLGPAAEIEERMLRVIRWATPTPLRRMTALTLLAHLARIQRPIDFGSRDDEHDCFLIDLEQRRLRRISYEQACDAWRVLSELLAEANEQTEQRGPAT